MICLCQAPTVEGNEGSLPPELGKNLSNTSNVTTRKECTLGILGEDRDVGK